MDALPLSAIDHVLSSDFVPAAQLVFRFPGTLDVGRVEEAFRATVAAFEGTSGCLVRLSDTQLGLDTSADLAAFRVTSASPDTPLSACIDSVETKLGVPLVRARVTQLGDQGTALGLAMSHALADGYGYFLFLSAWAAHARGQPFPPPNLNRALLSNSSARSVDAAPPALGQLQHSGFYVVSEDYRPPRLTWRERYIAASSVEPTSSDRGLSANDYITGVLWKEYMAVERAEAVTLACAVDIRRHRPELGPLYFGNAILLATTTVDADALRRSSPQETAALIRAAVYAVPARIDAAIAELEELRTSQGLQILTRLRGFQPHTGFLVSNLSRIPMKTLDFGLGAPLEVEIASVPPRSRTCIVLPASEGRYRLMVASP
jgi:hypothetical protein